MSLNLRQPAKFEKFYDSVISQLSGVTDSLILPRSRKLPRRLDDGTSPHCYQCKSSVMLITSKAHERARAA